MTTKQRDAIERHGRKLLAIFPDATERDPVELCRKLRRLEAKAHRAAVDLCNIGGCQDRAEAVFAAVDKAVADLLRNGEGTPRVFINRDPRGYALKISDSWVRATNADIPRDWGGYGLIAPEINAKGE